MKEVKPSQNSKIMKLLTFNVLAKTRSRKATAIAFSHQNNATSRTRTTQYWENLVLVSKGLYQREDEYGTKILRILDESRKISSAVNTARL